MLKHLLIKNYVLIQNLEMEPSAELNIITGETGAGKSIMLGAIGLLLGNRADTKALFNSEDKCVIEASFDISSYDFKNNFEEDDIEQDKLCILRREISPSGKSRAFINDTPVNLDLLKKWGSKLMDVHSQHETLLLGNSNFQISIIDAYAQNKKLLTKYQELYKTYKASEVYYNNLLQVALNSKKELDFNNFQLKELLEAALIESEQKKKEEELKVLENAEEIKSKLNLVLQLLSDSENSVLLNLQQAEKYLSQLGSFSKDYEGLAQRIKSALIELKDVSSEANDIEATVEYNSDQVEKVKERLNKIYSLEKKHRVNTVEELLAIQNDLQKKVDAALNVDEEVLTTKKKLDASWKGLMSVAEELSTSRKNILVKIKSELESLLKNVGIPNALIEIKQEPISPNLLGIDQINFLFSANKGVVPQELKHAASGGEFSRLMLCIKYLIANKTALPTIVFDEIDTGISGEIAIKVGKMMRQMSQNHQVISISHLPQIAAQGTAHYYVYKDNSSERAVSKIKKLSQEDRVKQIAEMIGGEKPSPTAIKSAKELLSMN